jgi:hypothetical protein
MLREKKLLLNSTRVSSAALPVTGKARKILYVWNVEAAPCADIYGHQFWPYASVNKKPPVTSK